MKKQQPVEQNDLYQDRYLRHQARKKRQLMLSEGAVDKTKERRSQRVYNGTPIADEVFNSILKVAESAPSSCNRHGIKLKVITERKDKELLSGILVGGIGWVHRADRVVLFLADTNAYKSPNEKDFMHYCDVGFVAMAMWLEAEKHGVGAAYINPNITHKDVFAAKYGGNYIFCGALAFGNYDPEQRALPSEKGVLKDMLI